MNTVIAKYAIIMGLINIGLCVVSYSMGLDYYNMVMPNVTWGSIFPFFFFLVYIGGASAAILEAKKANGGFINFQQCFKVAFLSMFFASLMVVLFSVMLVTVVDPGYVDVMRKGTLNILMTSKDQLIKVMGEEGFMNGVKAIEEQNFGTTAQLQGLALKVIYYAIISFIMAFIFKRNNPDTDVNQY